MFRKAFVVGRRENRIPIEIAVQIAGHSEMPGVEMTFTENISEHGVRVLSSRRWRQHDMLVLASLPGDFRSAARVAYCERLGGGEFAIGLELLQPAGSWIFDRAKTDSNGTETPSRNSNVEEKV